MPALVLILGATLSCGEGQPTSSEEDRRKADLEAIERLHQKDVAASKARDARVLRALLTDDAVMMPPGSEWIRGKEELDRNFEEMTTQLSGVEILEYVQDFEEVQVVGDYAFEWGTVWGTTRSPEGEEIHSTYTLMRILERQEDGEWKVHRSIWNQNAAPSEDWPR